MCDSTNGNAAWPVPCRFRKFPEKSEGVWCSILATPEFPPESDSWSEAKSDQNQRKPANCQGVFRYTRKIPGCFAGDVEGNKETKRDRVREETDGYSLTQHSTPPIRPPLAENNSFNHRRISPTCTNERFTDLDRTDKSSSGAYSSILTNPSGPALFMTNHTRKRQTDSPLSIHQP